MSQRFGTPTYLVPIESLSLWLKTFGGYDVIRPPSKKSRPLQNSAGPWERQKTAENEGFFEKIFWQN